MNELQSMQMPNMIWCICEYWGGGILGNSPQFAKFANFFPYQTFPVYGIKFVMRLLPRAVAMFQANKMT